MLLEVNTTLVLNSDYGIDISSTWFDYSYFSAYIHEAANFQRDFTGYSDYNSEPSKFFIMKNFNRSANQSNFGLFL